MIDHAALAETIRRHEAAQGQPISRLGYFCAPFRPAEGPFSEHVIKVYRGLPDAGALDRLAAAHDDYVAALREAGVPLPETTFLLLESEGARVPLHGRVLPFRPTRPTRPIRLSARREPVKTSSSVPLSYCTGTLTISSSSR